MEKNKSKTGINIILLLAVVALMVGALLINQHGEYGGSDGEAENVIAEINPDYGRFTGCCNHRSWFCRWPG